MEYLPELPYSNKTSLQDEARDNVAKVIHGLEEALRVHDYHRGTTYYIRGLNTCLDQKIALSAKEREQICQVLWKTFQQPDLSLHIQTKVANVLARILKQVYPLFQFLKSPNNESPLLKIFFAKLGNQIRNQTSHSISQCHGDLCTIYCDKFTFASGLYLSTTVPQSKCKPAVDRCHPVTDA